MKFLGCILLMCALLAAFEDATTVAWSLGVWGMLILLFAGSSNSDLAERLATLERRLRNNPNAPDLAQRVAALEQQVADLQKQIAQSQNSTPIHDFRQPENKIAPEIPPISPIQTDIPAVAQNAADEFVSPPEIPPENSRDEHTIPFKINKTETNKRTLRLKTTKTEQADTSPNPILAWAMRGNPLLKTGVVVLFLGLAFLLRHVGGKLPLEIKYLSVLVTGTAAVWGGRILRQRQREYGLVLQGFGFAVMYLTVLAALKLHALLSPVLALAVMVALVAGMTAVALKQNAQIMAQVAIVGGLAAPVLASNGAGNHVVLLIYLSLLNTAVAFMAWFKTWRSLNWLSAIGTLGIMTAWGNRSYVADLFGSTEPFLLYHVVLYTLIACFFARNTLHEQGDNPPEPLPKHLTLQEMWDLLAQRGKQVGVLDSGLLFGTALTGFTLQYQMVEHWEYGAAWSALLFGAFYAAVAAGLFFRLPELKIVQQALVLLAALFATLAIPLAYEGEWTAAAWGLEAGLVYFFGWKQGNAPVRLGAVAVYALAVVAQMLAWDSGADTAIMNGSALGTSLLVLGGGAMYAVFFRQPEHTEWAIWERNAQTFALIATLTHLLTVPLMMWHALGSMVVLTALGAGLTYWQYKKNHLQHIFMGAVAVYAVMWLYLIFERAESHFTYHWRLFTFASMVEGVLWLGMAYALHRFRQPETYPKAWRWLPNAVAWLLMWLAVPIIILSVEVLTEDWFSRRDFAGKFYFVWLVFFAVLWAWAKFGRWKQAHLFSVIMFGLLNWSLLASRLWSFKYYLSGSLIWLGLLILLLMNLRAVRSNFWHVYGVASSLIIGTIWLSKWGQDWGVWAVWSPLIVPAFAWALMLWVDKRGTFATQNVYPKIIMPMCADLAVFWLLWANWTTPNLGNLPYLPLLNPVGVATVAVLILLWQSQNTWRKYFAAWDNNLLRGGLLGLGWFALSAEVMRAWHFYDDVNWKLADLLASFGLQASLSIVWGLLAIALMVAGNKRVSRKTWLLGASVMAVVVAKLFLVELGNSGGVARIVSFIAVGVLLLVVGWFAPVPPKVEED